MDNKPKKRKPGRPPTKKKELNTPLNGIASKPQNENHIFEMVYCKPISFKNIYGLFKNYNSSVIRICIKKDKMMFITQSQSETTPIFVNIDPNRLHHYYAKKEMNVYIKLDQFYDAFNYLDKKGVYICTFVISKNAPENLYIQIDDKNEQFKHTYSFELIHNDEDIARINPDDFDESKYKLSWTITTVMFKKLIQCASSADGTMNIQKESGEDHNISVSYDKGKRVSYTGQFVSAKSIKLKDDIPKGESINLSLIVKNITGFTKSSLGENIYLFADNELPFCMKTKIDFNKKESDGENSIGEPAFTIFAFVPIDKN